MAVDQAGHYRHFARVDPLSIGRAGRLALRRNRRDGAAFDQQRVWSFGTAWPDPSIRRALPMC